MGVRIGRSSYIAVLFLCQLHWTAGFVGSLKKIKPKRIVAAVKDKAPQAAATFTAKSSTKLVSDAIGNNNKLTEQIQNANPQVAAKVIEQGKVQAVESAKGASAAATATGGNDNKLMEQIQNANPQVAAKVIEEGKVQALESAKGFSGDRAATTTTLSTTAARTESVDATASVRFNGVSDPEDLGTVHTELVKVRHKDHEKDVEARIPTSAEVQDVVREHIGAGNSKLAEMLNGAGKGLSWIKHAFVSDGKKIKDDADVLAKSVPESNAKIVAQTIPESVQDPVEVNTPSKFPKLIKDGSPLNDEGHTKRFRGKGSTNQNLQLYAVGCFAALCAIATAWQLVVRVKRREHRSPTLLMESEANMFMS